MEAEPTKYIHDGMELPVEDWSKGIHSFEELTDVIQTTHDAAQTSAVKAINRMQTMRNWLIGYYIVEFEQHGKDRAEYGSQLLKRLEERVNRKGLTVTLFQLARNFCILYPQMLSLLVGENYATVSRISVAEQETIENKTDIAQPPICATLSHKFITPAEKVISRLSFSHIRELISIDDPLARYFYEQEFILELGKGFCFESRQKRIIIDDEYFYPDLVFYNRILHCGVIIELKDEEFSHQNLGQLNAYVSYYRENEMQPGDNPPIGILLCTRKGKKMVEYALAGMDNQLFVSTYMLQIPDKKTLEDFLLKHLE